MKHHSSTSSSEATFQPRRIPWGLLGALVMLCAVEGWVRLQEPSRVIPYEPSGRLSYAAIRHYLTNYGGAEVAFIGSSRTREGISCPEVRERLEEELKRPVSVANYAAQGLSADEALAIIQHMLRQDQKPKILLYGISPLQISAQRQDKTQQKMVGELWYLSTWWEEATLRGVWRWDVLSDVIRTELSDRYLTFAYRAKVRHWLFPDKFNQASAPLRGEASNQHTVAPRNSLAKKPRNLEDARRVLGLQVVDGQYRFSDEACARIGRLVDACHGAGVKVVLFEIPLSGLLHEVMPAGSYEEYLDRISDIAEAHECEWITVQDLALTFTNEHFRDSSHMNKPGAILLSKTLVRRIIEPMLKGDRRLNLPGRKKKPATPPSNA